MITPMIAAHHVLAEVAAGTMQTQTADIATTTAHHCTDIDLEEVRLSQCDAGCKILACRICGAEYVAHSTVYGCRRA